MVTKYSVTMGLIAVADPDLQIRGGRGGHPDPEIRGGGLKNFLFRPFGSQFGPKITGRPGLLPWIRL